MHETVLVELEDREAREAPERDGQLLDRVLREHEVRERVQAAHLLRQRLQLVLAQVQLLQLLQAVNLLRARPIVHEPLAHEYGHTLGD